MAEAEVEMPVLHRWVKIVEGKRDPETQAPVLHHYTDAVGLHGIISSNVLWATEAQFSNDLSEQQYAIQMGLEVVEAVWKTRVNLGPWEEFLRDSMKQVFSGSFANLTQPYLVSFCENGDLLSQWRAYSRRSGFSLAFGPLTKDGSLVVRGGDGFRTILRKVIHEPVEQRERLSVLAERFIKVVETLPVPASSDEGSGLRSELLLLLILEMTDWACTVKHAAFSEEQEWRLVAFPMLAAKARENIMVRATPESLLPYVILQPASGQKLPIVEIRCGPSRLQQESAKAVGVLLRRHGYPAVPVPSSAIPLRT